MKLTIILTLAATAVCTTTSIRLPAGVEYTQISPAEIPDSIVLAKPPFNETTALSDLDARDADLTKRANHGVYLCVDANWKGYCVKINSPSGVCGMFDITMCHCDQFIGPSFQNNYLLTSVLP